MAVSLANILLSTTSWIESNGQSRVELDLHISLSSCFLSLSESPQQVEVTLALLVDL